MHESVFTQLSIVVAIGAAMAVLMRFLHQPLIIGHIFTGVIAGPAVFGILTSDDAFTALSSVGVALLLFIIGLDLSVKAIVKLGRVVVFSTFAQVGMITWLGFIVSRFLNFGRLESLIIGVALAMSSTIIIVKIFNDKKETTRLYAQIAIGVLLLQDVFATAAKIGLSAKHEGGNELDILMLIGRGVALTLLLYILSRYFIPRFTRSLESSKELLLLFALGWGLGFATLFQAVGFSIEIGALFAGVGLGSLPYSNEMASRLKPLRDFFIVIFFITLGQTIVPSELLGALPKAIILSVLVLIMKPLIVLITLGFLGYTKRNSFKTAISLGQISEFSLVFIAAAISSQLASPTTGTIITLVALITFTVSTYCMKYDDELYELFEDKLRFFERKHTQLEQKEAAQSHTIVMFGYRKGGSEFIKTFQKMGKRFVVVDYDPEVIDILERHNTNFIYGDATDLELFEEIRLDKAKLIVSTISDNKTNTFLANWLKKNNPKAVFVCSADTIQNVASLYEDGASYVMMPHYIGSEKLSAFIKKNGLKRSEFKKQKQKHMVRLQGHYAVALSDNE